MFFWHLIGDADPSNCVHESGRKGLGIPAVWRSNSVFNICKYKLIEFLEQLSEVAVIYFTLLKIRKKNQETEA